LWRRLASLAEFSWGILWCWGFLSHDAFIILYARRIWSQVSHLLFDGRIATTCVQFIGTVRLFLITGSEIHWRVSSRMIGWRIWSRRAIQVCTFRSINLRMINFYRSSWFVATTSIVIQLNFIAVELSMRIWDLLICTTHNCIGLHHMIT